MRTDGGAAAERGSHWLVQVASAVGGAAIGVGLCVLLFRGTDWSGVGRAIASADLRWIAAVIVVGGASHLARARRLAAIVGASRPAGFRDLFAVNQVGLLVNYTIPARVGEAIRTLLLAWFARMRLSESLAVVAVDRVFDVIALLIMVLIAWFAFPADAHVTIPQGAFNNDHPVVISSDAIMASAVGLVLVLVGALGVLILLHARRKELLRIVGRALDPVSRRLSARVQSVLQRFSDGMNALGSRAALSDAFLWSMIAWGANVLGMSFLLLAFPVKVSFLAPVMVQLLVVLATSITIAPGIVGQYHVAVVVGLFLTVPGIGVTEAKAISLVGHLVVLLQVGLLGLYSLADREVLARVMESLGRARGDEE